MMPPLFKALAFSSDNEALRSLMKAVDLIQRYVGTSYKYYRDEDEVPLEDVVSAAWLNEVVQITRSGKLRINRISYEMCVFQTLREQLRCRAVWVQGANRYRNPDDDLPADFARRRASYYEALQQPQDAEAFTNRLRQEMVDGLSRLNEGLPRNGWLTLETGRKHPLKLSPLPAQADPLNLDRLKQEIQLRWPMTALLDMLKETDVRTHFTDKFQTSATREQMDAATQDTAVVQALDFILQYRNSRRKYLPAEIDIEFASQRWQRLVEAK